MPSDSLYESTFGRAFNSIRSHHSRSLSSVLPLFFFCHALSLCVQFSVSSKKPGHLLFVAIKSRLHSQYAVFVERRRRHSRQRLSHSSSLFEHYMLFQLALCFYLIYHLTITITIKQINEMVLPISSFLSFESAFCLCHSPKWYLLSNYYATNILHAIRISISPLASLALSAALILVLFDWRLRDLLQSENRQRHGRAQSRKRAHWCYSLQKEAIFVVSLTEFEVISSVNAWIILPFFATFSSNIPARSRFY